MNIPLFISLLFGFQLCYWIIGRLTSKNINNQEDYFLAGKSVQLFPLMMTFLAIQVGGGIILGAAEEAYHYGWPVLFYPLGTVLGLIALGLGVGRRLAEYQVSTVAQIFEVAYQSRLLRRIVAILSVVSLFMILVAQIIASSKFLVSLGLTNIPLFIAFWAIVILYTSQGGLKAVISTDMVQAALFTAVFLFCFGYVFCTNPSVSSLQWPQQEHFTKVSSKLYGWLLMPLLSMFIEQDMAQRCFAGASPRTVSLASLLAGVVMMAVCFVPVFFGYLANRMDLEIPPGGSVLITTIAQTTNSWITAFAGCAVLAAIISSSTSLINAIGSNLANDLNLSSFQEGPSVRAVQAMTCVISIASLFFAFYFDNIVDVLIQSYDLSVSCLIVPLLMALYRKQGHFLAAMLSMLFGVMGFFLFRIYPMDFPKEIGSILLSLLGYGLGEIFVFSKRQVYEL